MQSEEQHYQRATQAAIVGLIVQAAAAVTLILLGLWVAIPAILALGLYAVGGIAVWLLTAIIFNQYRLEHIETFEATEAQAGRAADSSIFREAEGDLHLARRRLQRLIRWGVPIVSVLVLVWFAVVSIGLLRQTPALRDIRIELPEAITPFGMIAIMGVIGFVCFIVSRYVAGMAKVERWQLLRGPAGHLAGIMLGCIALGIGFAALHMGNLLILRYMVWIFPLVIGLLCIEMLINQILDFYRPRKPHQPPRAAYDSRLLALIASPESVARSINEAINYQFGFEITRSWFWVMLGKLILPLIIFGVLVMLALSSVVLVRPNEQAVVLRFGRIVSQQPLEPGIHLKLPWPVDSTVTRDTQEIRRMPAGSIEDIAHDVAAVLWTNQHGTTREEPFITQPANLPSDQDNDPTMQDDVADDFESLNRTPSVALINMDVFVHYRIEDLVKYLGSYVRPEEHLSILARTEVARYLGRRRIDMLLGKGRAEMSAQLRDRIQQRVAEAGLGLQIVDVPVTSIHPPQEVAEAFHQVVMAGQEEKTTIETGRQQQIALLADTAGTLTQAQRLLQAIDEHKTLIDTLPEDNPRVVESDQQLRMLFSQSGGEVSGTLSRAFTDRWARVTRQDARTARFVTAAEAYLRAPRYYRMRTYLETLNETLTDPLTRKFLLLSDREDLVLRFDFTQVDAGFMRGLMEEE